MFVESPNASSSRRLFVGSGAHAGEFLVLHNGTWYICESLSPVITVEGYGWGPLRHTGTEYNGQPVYADTTTTPGVYLFKSVLDSYGWVLRSGMAEPRAYEDASGLPQGDYFFYGEIPASIGQTSTLTQCPAWAARTTITANITLDWDVWTGPDDENGPCGVYVKGHDERHIGFPAWTCTAGASGGPTLGTLFVRSRFSSGGRYGYGTIRWHGRAYVYGEYGTGTWWEGDEPAKGHDTVYRPYVMVDGQSVPDSSHKPFTVAFHGYVPGGDSAITYATEISLWR